MHSKSKQQTMNTTHAHPGEASALASPQLLTRCLSAWKQVRNTKGSLIPAGLAFSHPSIYTLPGGMYFYYLLLQLLSSLPLFFEICKFNLKAFV